METSDLLNRIEAYCTTHNVSVSTFGRKAVNDGKLVERLRAGKTITLQTFARVNAFLDLDNGAASAPRPVPSVPRPAQAGAQ